MKKLFCLAVAMLILPMVLAVRIEEVYYDPIGTESGGEAVVLYNPLNLAVDISGWTIKTETSNTDVTLPVEAVIDAQGYYLITDVGWDENKDDVNWESADYEEAITLSNSDAGVALINSSGDIVSSVGWGNSDEILEGLYEGIPAIDVDPGNSLLRMQDSNDNSVDFVSSIPQLKSSRVGGNETHKGIVISLNVLNYAVTINYVNVTPDDFEENGTQVLLNPGREKEITVSALLTHELNYSFIENVTVNNQNMSFVEEVNVTSAVFEAKLNINYSTIPGNYGLLIAVGEEEIQVSYEVMSLMAIEIDAEEISLDVKDKDLHYSILGDVNGSTENKPSVKNIGNVELDLGVKATNLESEGGVFGLDNIRYSFDNDFYSSKAGQMSTELEVVNVNLDPTELNEFALDFFVAEDANVGSYQGTIIISAVSSE